VGAECGGTAIELLVHDNGRGFHPEDSATAGRGLRTMRSRAQRLQAELSINSVPGAGTVVGVLLPVRRAG
jgi:signal transduction histidine kinase